MLVELCDLQNLCSRLLIGSQVCSRCCSDKEAVYGQREVHIVRVYMCARTESTERKLKRGDETFQLAANIRHRWAVDGELSPHLVD